MILARAAVARNSKNVMGDKVEMKDLKLLPGFDRVLDTLFKR